MHIDGLSYGFLYLGRSKVMDELALYLISVLTGLVVFYLSAWGGNV